MPIDPHIFRAYDIRGKAGTQITEEVSELIGRGFGTIVREMYGADHRSLAVGRDARTHSPAFEDAVVRGLRDAGCNVLRIGPVPSPMNYFTVCDRGLDGSIQITASHNGPEDNGLKLQTRGAAAFSGDDLQRLYKKIIQGAFLTGNGTKEETDAFAPYLAALTRQFGNPGKGIRAVVDTGNGVAGPAYTTVLRALGIEVTGLFTEPDGRFPNHLADPSKQETLAELQKTVLSHKADIGLAFDGDGDRVGVVDETGAIRTADEILLLLAEEHLKRHPGKPVVFTVSNSGALETEIRRWGGEPVMCAVGHSFVEHEMLARGSLLGGEQSGHFFCFEKYHPFDDALVAALHVLRILSDRGKPFSALFRNFPKVYQMPELRPHCPDSAKARIVTAAAEHFAARYPVNSLDGARIDFGDGAWAGIRKSNTSPRLSICIEARSPGKLKEVERIVLEHLKTYPEIMLPFPPASC